MSKMETPEALAGATGEVGLSSELVAEQYRLRADAATALCHAIAECHRDDAVIIMDAALADLSMGSPLPVFLDSLDDARWWASYAAPQELRAFAYAVYEAMSREMQARFRAFLNRRATA